MGALLSVARGSAEPARFIILEHNGERDDLPTVVLVGKGITFDSGDLAQEEPGDGANEGPIWAAAAAVLGATAAAWAPLTYRCTLSAFVPGRGFWPRGGALANGKSPAGGNGWVPRGGGLPKRGAWTESGRIPSKTGLAGKGAGFLTLRPGKAGFGGLLKRAREAAFFPQPLLGRGPNFFFPGTARGRKPFFGTPGGGFCGGPGPGRLGGGTPQKAPGPGGGLELGGETEGNPFQITGPPRPFWRKKRGPRGKERPKKGGGKGGVLGAPGLGPGSLSRKGS